MSQAKRYKYNPKEQCPAADTSVRIVTTSLRPLHKVVLLCFLPGEAILWLKVTLTMSASILTPNLTFFLFGSRPLGFKSSFKLRKVILLWRTSISLKMAVQQSRSEVSRPAGRSCDSIHWWLSLSPQIWKFIVLKSLAFSCTLRAFQWRGQYEGVWPPKVSMMKATNSEYLTLEFKLVNVLRIQSTSIQFSF